MTGLAPVGPAPAEWELVVRAVRELAPDVRAVDLAHPDARPLPAHPPGAHVRLRCGQRWNAYSLTGSGRAGDTWSISVQHRAAPEGAEADRESGSAWVHRLVVGDRVRVSLPRNGFSPVASAVRHLLVAGGIGVTPILSHARAAAELGRDVQVVLAARAGQQAPHAADLAALCGDRLTVVRHRAHLAAVLDDALTRQPMGTHLYVCGPEPMRAAVLAAARAAGWPDARLHSEAFTADGGPGRTFAVRLAASQRTVTVPAGVSMLAALAAAGVEVPAQCRTGVCGRCRIGVVAGVVDHRDVYLEPDERDHLMTPCVSRGLGPLEVDL